MLRQFKNIFALAALCLSLLASCAGRKQEGTNIVLPDQTITITEVNHAKYATVYWFYKLPLPGGKSVKLYGKNGDSGYYYKNYDLKPGQQVVVDLVIYADCGKLSISNADLSAYKY